jgi:hypothetical protein
MEENKLVKKEDINNDTVSDDLEDKYVILMETNGKECESWYYFIKYKGNEESLSDLNDIFKQIDWYIIDDLSTFDLDLEHFVSAKTAKEMIKVELNCYSFHRKFDGKLKTINIKFKKKDNNEKKITRIFDLLSYGQIEDFIDGEDIDEEDLTDYSSEENSEDDTQNSSSSSDEDDEGNSKKSIKNIPPALLNNNRPGWAKAKGKKKRHKKVL